MKITHDDILNESNQMKSCSLCCIDTKEILCNVTFLQQTYGHLSLLHSIYLEIIRDIQINLVERLKNKQFDEPYFVASTTAHFVREIMNDLQHLSDSDINKQITKFQLQNPEYGKHTMSSKLSMIAFYNFLVNQMSDLEDNLRANAMIKSGKICFTSHDKNQIVAALTSVIYQHLQITNFPKNMIGTFIGKLSENSFTLVIRFICVRHINKSMSIANFMIQH